NFRARAADDITSDSHRAAARAPGASVEEINNDCVNPSDVSAEGTPRRRGCLKKMSSGSLRGPSLNQRLAPPRFAATRTRCDELLQQTQWARQITPKRLRCSHGRTWIRAQRVSRWCCELSLFLSSLASA